MAEVSNYPPHNFMVVVYATAKSHLKGVSPSDSPTRDTKRSTLYTIAIKSVFSLPTLSASILNQSLANAKQNKYFSNLSNLSNFFPAYSKINSVLAILN